MKKRLLSLLLLACLLLGLMTGCQSGGASQDARISVEGSSFVVNGNEIWMNGGNVPWDNWNDFGGNFDGTFWNNEFSELHEAGVNSVRVWITCDGTVGIQIDDSGNVTGATDAHWTNLDTFFALAEKYHIYVMATLMSFDNFKEGHSTTNAWRSMVQSTDKINSYVDNYLKPFLERYKDNDYLWSIDLCNEPDWIVENEECGKLMWESLGTFFGTCAAAIHENSEVLVTLGFGMIKYCSDRYSGDYGSNEFLQSCYADEDAYLDFNSVHYYEWEAPYYANPFDVSPADFGLDASKPSVLGEFPANGMTGENSSSPVRSLAQCYTDLYNQGWNGAFPWTANGVDGCGDFSKMTDAVNTILGLAEDKIFPLKDRELQ